MKNGNLVSRFRSGVVFIDGKVIPCRKTESELLEEVKKLRGSKMTKKIKTKKEESSQLLPEITRNEEGGYEIKSTSQTQIKNLFAAVGTKDEKILSKRLMETMRALEGKPGANTAGVALSLLSEIAPKDGVEGMLAAQMVATHEMAMIMARRSVESETVEIIESAVNLTAKLNRSFTGQMDALQRYRTKGQQKIVVEHQQVTVESGGQAVIGDVHHGGGSNGRDA